MKKLLNNKKGFTLIELLAVIVILAILVMVAIPAVTKYLNSARQGTFVDNAKSAIGTIRNTVVLEGANKTTFDVDEINEKLEKKLITSPFGGCYCKESSITYDPSTNKYSIILFDEDGYGWFSAKEENALTKDDVEITGVTEPSPCTKVTGCPTSNPSS